MAVYRIFVEKRQPHDVEGQKILGDLQGALGLSALTRVRVLNRYDTEGISPEDFESVLATVFAEPPLDDLHRELPKTSGRLLAIEYLPGQYDQRADSAAQCISLCTGSERPIVKTARVYLFEGNLTDEEFEAVRRYLINPIESREASLALPATLADDFPLPPDVMILDGFSALSPEGLREFAADYTLAMDEADLLFCQNYFREEGRDPGLTELRVIDTYWSDHCRHTTFLTELEDISVTEGPVKEAYDRYLELRATLGRSDKPVTLMDIATIGARALSARGLLEALDKSEEINACSVKITVDVDGRDEEWLLMFKNETHNHPTEIEPFGGAATCLGGAIRDPLSGRAYVYQAMRLSGGANPLAPLSETLPGKLPQRKIATQAAAGYSSYGNQIGLATGLVQEIYHDSYRAKRMEVGAVLAAAKAKNVIREIPEPGDIVLLVGGATGRDGCGGATGSSKSHTTDSLSDCGAEVQKGNAPEERKLQRLFRNPEAARLIRRCNDFGAGGVSVAVGELADSLAIYLDNVPKKYNGLDGTELAISESQERMAVVLRAADMSRFIALAAEENLYATHIADVTDTGRMVMQWRGKEIVSLSRAFLNSNGAKKSMQVTVLEQGSDACSKGIIGNLQDIFCSLASSINIASQKGLVERFDSSVGAATILAPFGGRYQETPIQAMAAKLPVFGETNTASLMAYGCLPSLMEEDCFAGAAAAVYQSVAKVVAAGGSRKRCWLSFQEYFEKLGNDPAKWGKPFSALLGALEAQLALECAAIGGKDSMSGSFNDLSVVPTLVSFAVSTAQASQIISPELKQAGSRLLLLPMPELSQMKATLDLVEEQIASGNVRAAWVCGEHGIAEGIFKMSFGNRIGVTLENIDTAQLFFGNEAAIILETEREFAGAQAIGHTTNAFALCVNGETVDLETVLHSWQTGLEGVYPYRLPTPRLLVPTYSSDKVFVKTPRRQPIAKPRAVVCAFPGTNSEYDTARAFEREGAESEIVVIRNRTAADIEQSVDALAKAFARANIFAIPGGFSGGDEPEGSAKLIVAFLRNPRIQEAIRSFLKKQDGLMIGICNGFQALIKLGLVPYGDIIDPQPDSPTLTFNRIGRHQAQLINTRISSVNSPWMLCHKVGDIHTLPVSHGEGRLVATPDLIASLAQNGQIASQYVDGNGHPTLDTQFNPNFSLDAIEGLFSPDGRVFGKMAHSERIAQHVFKNVPGEKQQLIFRGAVEYFTK